MEQSLWTEGLRHEIRRAECHRPLTLRVVAGRGENDTRQLLRPNVRAHAREHFESRHVRHHEVEPHDLQVDLAIERFERLDAVERQASREMVPARASSG